MPGREEWSKDSLDRIELELALEEAIDTINADKTLSLEQRQRLIREIEHRIELGLWDEDDLNDDALGVLVQRLGPKWPKGKSGAAAVRPEPESSVEFDDLFPESPSKSDEGFRNSAGLFD